MGISLKSITNSIFPGTGMFFPGSSGGAGSSGDFAAQEEARKARLRAQIDAMYGIKPGGTRPEPVQIGGSGIFARLKAGTDVSAPQGEFDTNSSTADNAIAQLAKEKSDVSDATRGYYTDELGRQFTKAERETRFNLARQGLMGGSEDAYQQGEVRSDRDLGATRVDEAVRRAAASLDTQREQERENAINLVNAGAGESAVSSAQAGLKNAFANVSNAQKANLFGDLFSGAATTAALNNNALQQQALYNRYRSSLSSFFPAGATSTSGRVTSGGVY